MTKQITEKRLYNITLFYLSKYESSSEKVRQMLQRRLLKASQQGIEIPDESQQWITKIIGQMQSLGYINDKRYAENQVRILSRQGKSKSFIVQKLRQSGIDSETICTLLDDESESDVQRAILWLKRHKKGGFRLKTPDKEIYCKDLSALGRQGFSFQTAKKALSESLKQIETEVFEFENFENFNDF